MYPLRRIAIVVICNKRFIPDSYLLFLLPPTPPCLPLPLKYLWSDCWLTKFIISLEQFMFTKRFILGVYRLCHCEIQKKRWFETQVFYSLSRVNINEFPFLYCSIKIYFRKTFDIWIWLQFCFWTQSQRRNSICEFSIPLINFILLLI